jgi:hypothetical protein
MVITAVLMPGQHMPLHPTTRAAARMNPGPLQRPCCAAINHRAEAAAAVAHLVDLHKADFDGEVCIGLVLNACEQLIHDTWDDSLVLFLWRPSRPHGVGLA